MTLNDFTARIKQAVTRVVHFSATVTLADRRIKAQRKLYLKADNDTTRGKARARIVYWKARKYKAEDLRRNWKPILKRRRAQRRRWLKSHPQTDLTPNYGSVEVPGWMVGTAPGRSGERVDWLQLAKDHGWTGYVVSGRRTPEYSESLCFNMCGAPSCPGTCAGRSTNHACPPTYTCQYPEGAIDVTDYYRFRAIMEEISAPLQNDLPSDPVHFSNSGH